MSTIEEFEELVKEFSLTTENFVLSFEREGKIFIFIYGQSSHCALRAMDIVWSITKEYKDHTKEAFLDEICMSIEKMKDMVKNERQEK